MSMPGQEDIGCPEETILMLYLQGVLDDATQENIAAHIERCALCSELLLVVAELSIPDAESMDDWRETIEHYEIKGILGKGGMGVVYEAYDRRLNRPVALKMLHVNGPTDEHQQYKKRLIREARVLASLSHPHIVPVYEVGDGDGQIYLAMLLVRGETLRHWLTRERPHWTQILRVFLQACQALSAAHEVGAIHRDIKPENFLLTHDQHLYLSDFGLVTTSPQTSRFGFQAPEDAVDKLTATRAIVGTHGYIAPELYRGQPADVYSDQFSLCVALYESIYQQMPYVSLPFHEHLNALESGHIREPLLNDAPADLLRVIRRGLHPIPAKRHASIDAIESAFQRLLDESASEPTARKLRLTHINASMLRFVGVGVGLLLAGGVVSQYLMPGHLSISSPPQERSVQRVDGGGVAAFVPLPDEVWGPSSLHPRVPVFRLPDFPAFPEKTASVKQKPLRRRPNRRAFSFRHVVSGGHLSMSAVTRASWWLRRLNSGKARFCVKQARRFHDLPNLVHSKSRGFARRYSTCLAHASHCLEAYRVRLDLRLFRLKRRAYMEKRRRLALFEIMRDCPPRALLRQLLPVAQARVKRVKHGSGGYRWCVDIKRSLTKKWKRFPNMVKAPGWKRRWQAFLLTNAQCFSVYIGSGENIHRNVCTELRKLRRMYQETVGIDSRRRRLFKTFPACR